MTDIPAVSTATTASPSGTGSSAAPQIGADFQTFLTMLTTQLQHQDPLDPVESQDFAVQLATFSSVEQQTQTNALLTDLGSRLDLLGMAQLSPWIGKRVSTAAEVPFEGTPLEISFEPTPAAEFVELVVLDESGQDVQRLPLQPGDTTYLWTGESPSGTPVAEGIYRFEVQAVTGGAPLPVRPAEAAVAVQAVESREGELLIVIGQNGESIPAGAVTGLMEPAE